MGKSWPEHQGSTFGNSDRDSIVSCVVLRIKVRAGDNTDVFNWCTIELNSY